MSTDMAAEIRQAVTHFWRTRTSQSGRQGKTSGRDRGARGAVTGGKQMDGFVGLVRELLLRADVPGESIFINRRLELPGWFRAEKQWDLVVVHNDELLAALEFKSQVGPSFGNNFNNRSEEALGSASDIWAAYREGAFRTSSRPFLGYLMLLQDCAKSQSPVKVLEPHFPVFKEFQDASYQDRYNILIEKLVRERLYDAACLLLAPADAADDGRYTEPHPELTFAKFISPLVAHVSARCR